MKQKSRGSWIIMVLAQQFQQEIASNISTVADVCITVDGPSNRTTCMFPFTYDGGAHKACIMGPVEKPWCQTYEVDKNGMRMWGYCDPECRCDGAECPFKESDEGKTELKQ